MKSGTYILEAESVYYTFEPVTAMIDSETEALPDLRADRVQICGQIDIDKSEMFKYSGERRIVIIKPKQEYSEQKMHIDDSGSFCTEVKMGEYTVTPLVNLDESSYELHLTPNSLEVKVEGNPINNLKFSQIKVNVEGRVKYLDSEDYKDVKVSLKKEKEEYKTVEVHNGKFAFKSILPGKYKIEIQKKDYCWENTEKEVEVKTQDVNNIEFVQTGYKLQYYAEKDVDVKINNESTPIHFTAGDHSYCVKSKGEYKITPIGCYKFLKPTFTYSTYSPNPIKLIPEQYLIEGHLEVKDSSLVKLDEHISMKCKMDSEEKLIKLQKQKDKYFFLFYSKKNIDIEIIPTLTTDSDGPEQNILFNPKKHKVNMKDNCITGDHAIVFIANKGLIIKGKVTPPVSGIEVVARDLRDNSVADHTITSSTGEYRLGPLYDSEEKFQVIAQKEGYRLIRDPNNSYDFSAEQLSSLSIIVKDYNDDPLSEVAFDLSHSARSYRNHTRTNSEVLYLEYSREKHILVN